MKLETSYLKLNSDLNAIAIVGIIGSVCLMLIRQNINVGLIGLFLMVYSLVHLVIYGWKFHKLTLKLKKFYRVENLYYKIMLATVRSYKRTSRGKKR